MEPLSKYSSVTLHLSPFKPCISQVICGLFVIMWLACVVLHQIQTWLRDLHSALFSAALYSPQTKLGIKGKRQLYAVRLHLIAKDSLTSIPVTFRLQNSPPFCVGAGQQRASGQKRVLACIYLFYYFATQNKLQQE